jgi:stage V sporulation protein S
MDIIKVKSVSRTAGVAGAIAGVMRDQMHAEVQAIGAGAVNQSVKALVLAKSFLEQDGIHIVFTAEFVNVDIDGKIRTAIKFNVVPKESVPEPLAKAEIETELETEPEAEAEPGAKAEIETGSETEAETKAE